MTSERKADQQWLEQLRAESTHKAVTDYTGKLRKGATIGNVNGSTWNDSLARARVLPDTLACLRCGNPARGYEPHCATCADWLAVDRAMRGDDQLGPWPAVLGVALGLLSLAGVVVLVAGWVL